MDYQKKILKYKTKYLTIKNNINQVGGRLVNTIKNNGAITENGISYTNQCLWLSILKFLNKNGFPYLTFTKLRSDAGLTDATRNTPFDLNPDPTVNPYFLEFFNAGINISRKYNLDIQIFCAVHNEQNIVSTREFENSQGVSQENIYRPFEFNDSERSRTPVKIINFRDYHFELIDDIIGEPFKPAVLYDGKMTAISDLPPEEKENFSNKERNRKIDSAYGELLYMEILYLNSIKELDENKDVTEQEKIKLKQKYLEDFLSRKNSLKEMTQKELGTLDESLKNLFRDKPQISPTGSTLQKPTPTSSSTPTRVTLQKPTPTSSSKLTENTHKEFKPEPQKTKEEWKELFKKAFGPK